MIQSKAMLVDLTIRQWTATKHDKAVSAEVETAHAAKDAGRVHCVLRIHTGLRSSRWVHGLSVAKGFTLRGHSGLQGLWVIYQGGGPHTLFPAA